MGDSRFFQGFWEEEGNKLSLQNALFTLASGGGGGGGGGWTALPSTRPANMMRGKVSGKGGGELPS